MGLIVIALVLLFVATVLVALKIARAVQKSIDRAHERGNKQAERGMTWLGHFHSIWWLLGAGAGALKYIYKAWRTAPPGSAEKLGWGALLAFIAALGLLVIVKLVDRKLNPPYKTPSPSGERELMSTDAQWFEGK